MTPEMDLEARERQLKSELEAVVARKDDEIASLNTDLEYHVVGNAIADALAAESGSLPLLAPHVRESVRMQRNADGEPIAVVVGANGLRRLRPAAKNMDDLMSVSDLVKTLRDDPEFRHAFDDSGSSETMDREASGSQGPDDGARIL